MDHPFALYNPALLPPDVLLREYTARMPLLETLLGIVRGNAPGHPPQHVLLIGARGMGKTTTLWAVAHKVSRDPELARLWQPVVFDEESRRVGDLADFWLEAIRQWEFATQDTAPDRAGRLLSENPPDIEDRAHRLFTDLVTRSGRRALLLIDNLNDLFASIRDPEPLHRLRATLMQDSGIMLIGGATSYFEQVTSVDQPFFDFFRNFDLKKLSLEEMRECLLALAKSHQDTEVEKTLAERGGSLRALHILTGGNPRLIKTFYRMLRGGLHTDIRSDLEKLIDEFTPYFKAIVDALPVQQQRIFDAVALAWNPVEVATIATATRLPSNQVSAQLRTLTKSGLITEAPGHPKKKTYLLADRFSNIHYLMRHGRAARNRLDWFVATLQVLFPDQTSQMIAKLAHDSAECGPQGLRDARDVLHSALRRSETAADRQKLLHHTLAETWSEPAMAQLSAWFDVETAKAHLPEADILAFCQHMPAELRKELGYKPEESRWWYELTDFLEKNEALDLAEAAYHKAIELDSNDFYPWLGLGLLYQIDLKKFEASETAYRRALEIDKSHAPTWFNLGNLMREMRRADEAHQSFLEAIRLDDDYAAPWQGLGAVLQYDMDRPIEAEKAYRKALEINPLFEHAWFDLAHLLHIESRPQEAEKAYLRTLAIDPKWGIAHHNLARLYHTELHRKEDAEKEYLEAIQYDESLGKPWVGIAELKIGKRTRSIEAREASRNGLMLEPTYSAARYIFTKLCQNHAEDWQAVLPGLFEWFIRHPQAQEVFDFIVTGVVRYAQLKSPAEALALFEGVSNATPFESIQDALYACKDKAYLHKLAPERQEVAMELVKRIQAKS
jgi:tetratricopeptide (TPR) repeat protein